MIIANKLKSTNRAEYLLYLWQVEDLIRSYDCNKQRIAEEYLPQFQLSEELLEETKQWYVHLCEMMHSEGLRQHGHLQLSKNILQELTELHVQLLSSTKFPYYSSMYYKVLPYIVELRQKSVQGDSTSSEVVPKANAPELEICFNFLYGVLLLKLRKQPVSEGTTKAVADISALLGTLSDYYFKDKEQPIEF